MQNLSPRTQVIIGCGLALLMAATRVPYLPGTAALFGASWAVFFLAGFYLRSVLAVPALLALAVVLDGIALGWSGVSSYCLTPAYAMLAPAYASLWLAGRWYAGQYRFAWASLLPLAGSLLVGTVLCELISSGSFYWGSGIFANTNLAEFVARELQYFPSYLASTAFWVGVAALVHIGIALSRGERAATAAS